MTIKVKRVYEKVAASDGKRVLADRLWPRGISKEHAALTAWIKESAPSNELRAWFHEDPDKRWSEFKKNYQVELKERRSDIRTAYAPFRGTVTLVTAVKDIEHSHIPVLKAFLEKMK
jgi:uncharacterized protein YeaO (DUF488 family)